MTTRVLIIFGSTYGYTEQYATWLAEDLRALPQAPEVETVPASKVTPEQAEAFDAFVIAGSDYGGFLNGAPALRKKILPIIAPKKNLILSQARLPIPPLGRITHLCVTPLEF